MFKDHFPPLITRDLPKPPRWYNAIGVGVIVIGMALGTGELIMWPHLVSKFGLGILWLALVGITLQYFINQEVARHTLATGESFFTTSARLFYWSPIFWLGAGVVLYIWPGWASTLGTILAELAGFGNYQVWAWLSLGLVLVLTFNGRSAYKMLELSLKIIVPVFITLLVIISFFNLHLSDLWLAWRGLTNFGYIPKGIDLNVLLGAIVFAGAGGMLNLCTSLWYRDKQMGMAHYEGRITNPISGKPETIGVVGSTFHPTKENMEHWRGWMKYVFIDQGIIFWLLGTISLVLLAVNAYVVLGAQGLVPEGQDLAILQARIFGDHWGVAGSKIYLMMTYLMLFSVMWTIIDALTRIITDIIYTNARAGKLQKKFRWLERISIHHLYYFIVVVVVFIQAILIPFNQPLGFLVVSSVLGGLSMAIYTPLLLFLNNWRLPKELRPGIISNIFLVGASLFYIYFAIIVINQNFFS